MFRINRGLIVGLLALVVGFAVSLSSEAREEKAAEPTKKVNGILGDDTVAILKNATRVEPFRIQSMKSNDEKLKRIGDYPIIATGKEKGKDFATRLDNVLFADATYDGVGAKCFDPGVVFRVWTEKKEWVDVTICFHCQNLALTSYDANGKVVKKEVYGSFGGTASWTALVKLAKEAFPDDTAIQNLKEDAK